MSSKIEKIALVGNPNAGKSTVFNHLTGLNQHIGNYPGVTVDKKEGTFELGNGQKITLIDLPGSYSLYPRSEDEKIVYSLLTSPNHPDFPDLVVVIIDSSNLERNLLLFTQVYDLNIPIILGLNMMDVSQRKGIQIDLQKLGGLLGNVPIIPLNARKGEGMEELKAAIETYKAPARQIPFLTAEERLALKQTSGMVETAEVGQVEGEYTTALNTEIPNKDFQIEETKIRYQKIRELLQFSTKIPEVDPKQRSFTQKLDKILVHPIFGYAIFLSILFLMFQAVYSFAELPMNLIDEVFLKLSVWTKAVLPDGQFTNLIAEGIIPGIGGVVIFIPQIVLLFLFIVILEETGYMARVVFIMDRLLRPFGLNGKSVVPLISGVACAIPAIMATRTIAQWKERLITILVTPFMSCAARLPVYTLLIALVIPDKTIGGLIGLKGLVLFSLYLLGLLAALGVAVVLSLILQNEKKGFLVLELPIYKKPRWNNVFLILWEKTRLFIFEAGKIILAISIILWVMASYGPPGRIDNAVSQIEAPAETAGEEVLTAYENEVNTVKLENSFIGILGKGIEPAIAPLGYDWKIGIALITSFAAREVFVGSMATIYSIGEDFEENETLLRRMQAEINPATGAPVYTLASGISLMLFYAFAMQCMSTLAIVYRETKTWKWPIVQMVFMTIMAYVTALLAYQILS